MARAGGARRRQLRNVSGDSHGAFVDWEEGEQETQKKQSITFFMNEFSFLPSSPSFHRAKLYVSRNTTNLWFFPSSLHSSSPCAASELVCVCYGSREDSAWHSERTWLREFHIFAIFTACAPSRWHFKESSKLEGAKKKFPEWEIRGREKTLDERKVSNISCLECVNKSVNFLFFHVEFAIHSSTW